MEDGSPYRRLVARGDQPLATVEQQSEKARLAASIEERRRETTEQRQLRIAEWESRRRKQREPMQEVPDAFDFHLAGEQTLDAGEAYVIDATPRPGYHPKRPPPRSCPR